MSSKYKVRNNEKLHFITTTVIDWVDLFTRPILKHVVIESLEYCITEKGLEVNAFVLMPSHLHLIAKSKSNNKLEDIVRDFKKHIIKKTNKNYKRIP